MYNDSRWPDLSSILPLPCPPQVRKALETTTNLQGWTSRARAGTLTLPERGAVRVALEQLTQRLEHANLDALRLF